MKKRFTAALLALCLILALLPAGALASNGQTFTYPITVSANAGGTVTLSQTEAEKYVLINVTAKPDFGYELASLKVTGPNGENVELTKKSNTQYSFTMPWGAATVTAVFQAEGGQESVSGLPFTDVAQNAWYYSAVSFVYNEGMMNGTSDTLFAPNTNLTRAMIAQVLYNLEGAPSGTLSAFNDVPAGAWYASAVNWAGAQSIVTGYGDGTFGPMNNITREQVAAILYRYAQHKEYISVDKGDLTSFADSVKVSAWAKTALEWAVGNGVLSGKSGNLLDPTGTATRAEVAQILTNFCQRFVK